MDLILIGGDLHAEVRPADDLPPGYTRFVIRAGTPETEQVEAALHVSYLPGGSKAHRIHRVYARWMRIKEDYDRRNRDARSRLTV